MKFNTKASKKAKATSSKSTSTTAQSATSQNTTNANTQQGKAPVVGSISTTLSPNLDNLKLGLENVKREYERAIEQLHNYDRKLQLLLLIWTALLSVLSIVISSIDQVGLYLSNAWIILCVVFMIVTLLYILVASIPDNFKWFHIESSSSVDCAYSSPEDFLSDMIEKYSKAKKSVESAIKSKFLFTMVAYIAVILSIFVSGLIAALVVL